MSHAGLRQGATWQTVAPLVESQVSFLLDARSQYHRPTGATSSRAFREQELLDTPSSINYHRTSTPPFQHSTWSSHVSGGARVVARSGGPATGPATPKSSGAFHVQHLMEKFYLHDEDDDDAASAHVDELNAKAFAHQKRDDDNEDDVSSFGIPSTAEGEDDGDSKRASYVMAPSCSSGPIDPEDPSFQQRQQRLANFQRHRSTPSHATLPPAPSFPSFSLDDIAALLVQHQRRHHEDVHELLLSMEQRHALIADESAARYSAAMDETIERSVLTSSVSSSLNDAVARGSHRTEWEEGQRREELGRDALRERCTIADLMRDDVVAMVEAAEERQRDLERTEEEAASPPPPPMTPRPAQQFQQEHDDNAVTGGVDSINVDAANGVLQRLRALVGNLPPEQRRVVEQRIHLMEAQLLALKDRSGSSSVPPELPAMTTASDRSAQPLHATPKARNEASFPHRRNVDPYAPPSRSPMVVQHSTVTPTRKRSPAVRQVRPFSPGTLRKPLPAQPTRPQVVEFIRSMLQPLYDQEALDRDVFVGIVKHLSQTFFHQDGWLRSAEKLLGTQLVQEYHVNPSRLPALWKVYLHQEMCDIIGDADLPFVSSGL